MNRLGEILFLRNITVGELHMRTQISERALYNYTAGKPISSAYLERIAEALNVCPNEIQSADETPSRRLFNTGKPYARTRARQTAR